MSEHDWNFPFEEPLHEVFPQLHEAQNAWLAQVDSLQALDRKTHELIRMVVTVGLRNPPGVERHARLGARGRRDRGTRSSAAIMLTMPGLGVLPAVEAIPHARRGFEAASEAEED